MRCRKKAIRRARLIGIDISLASKKNAKLSKRREALIAENQKAWLGKTLMKALESDDVEEWLIELEWKLGYIHKARLRTEMDVDDLKLAQMLRALLKLDSAKFLAELHLGISDWEGETATTPKCSRCPKSANCTRCASSTSATSSIQTRPR
jgi:hypothetical protein